MKNSSEVHGLCLGEGGPYPDNRGNFPGTWKIERKKKTSEDIASKMQYNFRMWPEPNLFSGHSDKAGVLASRYMYAHSSCARMTQAANTGYTTNLTSVTGF